MEVPLQFIGGQKSLHRRAKTGKPQRFYFLGGGRFTLAEIAFGKGANKVKTALERVTTSRDDACKLLYEKLTDTNQGDNFQIMVADLLEKMGYEDVEIIGGKDDQGVDITCSRRDGIGKIRTAVQCKCKSLQKQIGPKDVSNLRDNLSTYQCQSGVIVTTTHLNPDAKQKAAESGKPRIDYIEHEELLDLFAEHEIGFKVQSIAYYEINTEQYEFLK